MGFGKWLEKKIAGHKEQRAINKRMDTAVKRVEEEERFKARISETKAKVRRQEAARARGGGFGGLTFVNPLEAMTGTGGFSPAGQRNSHRKTARKSGTTINVNGTKITVHTRTKKRKRQRRNSSPFLL